MNTAFNLIVPDIYEYLTQIIGRIKLVTKVGRCCISNDSDFPFRISNFPGYTSCSLLYSLR